MSLIPHPLWATARARPDHPVLRTPQGDYTARELCERVERVASAYRAQGIGPGTRVALRGAPSADFIVALHAIGWLGAAAFPLPWKLTEAELPPLLQHADARVGALPEAIALDATDEGACAPREWSLDEIRLIVATSGTTGAPRPIALRTRQLLFSAFGSAIRIGHLPSDRWVCTLPLNHVGGLSILFRCAWYGTTVELHPRFDPDQVNAAIDAGASLWSAVPQMLQRVLDARGDRPFPPSLRCILVGGAPASEALIARCRAISAPVSLTWGMTEAASQIATGSPGELEAAVPPLPFATVGAEAGRLWVRGPVALDGQIMTSDRGFIDESGRIHILGRADEVIISGGENIDPFEIEQVLGAHPAVREAAVVGVADPTWGARPVAFFVGDPVDEEALRAWCRGRLQGFKVPDAFHRIEALPRNRMGKLLRRALVERAADQAR